MATLTIADLDNGKRDLQTVDGVANSRAASVTTRYGQQTTTLYESIRLIGERGSEILSNLGFFVPVAYAPGLNVTEPNFTVVGPDGGIYAAQAGALPFTTGAWDPAQWYPIQNILNQKNLLVFDTYAEASAAAATLPDGQEIEAPDAQGKLSRYRVQSGSLVFQRLSEDAVYTNYTPAGVGAVARTVQEKLREVVSVKDFGAVGDGVADDTAAIQDALVEGAVVQFPRGIYKVTGSITLSAGQQIVGAGIGKTIFSCTDGFTVFDLASSYAGVSDCSFDSVSARTSGAYIKLSAATRGNFARRIKMNNAFYGVWINADAVINHFEDIEIINTRSGTGISFWINGGNDTFLSKIVADAPEATQPMCGVRLSRSQATWMTDCDLIHQGRGIQIDPDGASNGYITWCFFQDVACDLGTGDGVYINPNNATVKGLFFDNCWFSSNLNGVNATKTGSGAVDGVYFNGCAAFNNLQRGFWNQNAVDFDLNGCQVAGSSGASSGTYAGIELANNSTAFAVRNCRSGAQAGFGATQSYGLLIGSGCNNYIVTDNNFLSNVVAAAGDSSMGTSTQREVRGNLGFKTIASGSAVIAAGQNSISISHGLAGTPTSAVATPTNTSLGGLDHWTGSFAPSTFSINTSGNVGSNATFSWTVSLYN